MAETIGRIWNISTGARQLLKGHVSISNVLHEFTLEPFLAAYNPSITDTPDFCVVNPLFIRLWKKNSGRGSEFLTGHFGSLATLVFKNNFKRMPEDHDWNITVDRDQSPHPRRSYRKPPLYYGDAPKPYGRGVSQADVCDKFWEQLRAHQVAAAKAAQSWQDRIRAAQEPFRSYEAGQPYETTQEPRVAGVGPIPRGQRSFSVYEIAKFKEFGVEPPYTEERVKTVWRTHAKKNHPDRGGSHDRFIELSNQYNELLRILSI